VRMRVGFFLVAAIVLVVFAIIAADAATGKLFGVGYVEWFLGGFLSYLVDLVFDFGFSATGGRVVRARRTA
jgi:hypothetical protein